MTLDGNICAVTKPRSTEGKHSIEHGAMEDRMAAKKRGKKKGAKRAKKKGGRRKKGGRKKGGKKRRGRKKAAPAPEAM